MSELTQEEREQIEHQIAEYKENNPVAAVPKQPVAIPLAPNGVDGNQDFEDALNAGANPDKKERRRVKKKIKGLWRNWRTTSLDAKSLEIEKIACQIEIERAKTQAQLNEVRREEERKEATHWLELNKGNLEDIDANTTSRPSKFWYNLRRGCHHITKTTNNIPKIIKNLFWVGVIIIGLVLLKHFNVL